MPESRIEIDPDIENKIRIKNEEIEAILSPRASKNSSFKRRQGKKKEELIRSPYSRDSDRILHSKAYSRYIDKTQVFFLVDNDHITHRVLHVQLVSKIGRTIGRALGLNEDLIEAISLGHDIGHVPYGHLGESILSDLCEKKYHIGNFKHNVQTIQFLDKIENQDLTLQTLDGILCHDGEVHNKRLTPDNNLTWENFDLKMKDVKERIPSTFEGCVVRLADNIAYIGRDLQDAMDLGLIDKQDLDEYPSLCSKLKIQKSDFNEINWLLIDSFIKDIINSSYDMDYISFSEEISDCVKKFKDYNYEKIYLHPSLGEQKPIIKKMFETLFETYLEDFENNNSSSPIFSDMYNCEWINPEYKTEILSNPAILVRDYIAGMTDRYFDKKYMDIVLPKRRDNFYA